MRAYFFWTVFLGTTLLGAWLGFSHGSAPSTAPRAVQSENRPSRAGDLENDLLSRLEESDKTLRALYSRIEKLSTRVRDMEKDREGLRENLERSREELGDLRRKAAIRLVALYKFKQMNYVAPLLTTRNFRATIEAALVATRLVSSDHRFFLHLRGKIASIESLERILEEKEEELRSLQSRLKEQRRKLIAGKEREIQLLVQLRRRRQEAPPPQPARPTEAPVPPVWNEENIEEVFAFHDLSRHGEEKAAAVGPVETERLQPSEAFSVRRGTLPLPTTGRVAKLYGDGQSSSYAPILYNNGIVIEAPRGQEVKAVHDGKVVFAQRFQKYGKVMIIDHGEHYHTLIAHADRLLKRTGDRVDNGETVATVGGAGVSGSSMLYFEIRHHGQPVDPAKWLAVHTLTQKRGT